MIAKSGEIAGEAAGNAKEQRTNARAGWAARHVTGYGICSVNIRASRSSFGERNFSRSVSIARDALLLRSPEVNAPLEHVIASGHGPVVDPLEMIFSFLQ